MPSAGPDTDTATQRAVAFHGHMCPGLAIGIRAAEIAATQRRGDGKVIAIVETDMCAADAIQVLTGATFGNGQLVHRDFGKNAFTFFADPGTSGVRAVTRPDAFGAPRSERDELPQPVAAGQATPDDRARLQQAQAARSAQILSAPLEALFTVEDVASPPPGRVRPRMSVICEQCHEPMMEARSRRFGGRTLCIPCFDIAEGS